MVGVAPANVALLLGLCLAGCGSESPGRPTVHGDATASGKRDQSCDATQHDECRGGDCCASSPVVGGTFEQGQPDAFSATVSSFVLDDYEVTVGRFRNFVAAYDAWRAAGNPKANSGADANVPNSGWDAAWTEALPPNAANITDDPDQIGRAHV